MRTLLLLFYFFSGVQLFGQAQFLEAIPCMTTPQSYVNYVNQYSVNTTTCTEHIIPVVFHIIHLGGPENVRDELVLERLEKLNQDFALENPFHSQTPLAFQNVAAPVNITFRLATKDPDGNCTTGINRVYSPLTHFYIHENLEDSPAAQQLSDLIHWNPKSYLNIYIMDRIYKKNGNRGDFLHGLSTFPNDPEAFDGVYLSDNKFRFDNNYSTLTHEVGHWLNLLHLWGDGGCSGTDFVDDTPPQEWASYSTVCSNDLVISSCNNAPNGNMFSNFMDYGNCRTHFTAGQAERMCTTLTNDSTKITLTSLDNLIATGTDVTPTSTCSSSLHMDFSTEELFIHKCTPAITFKNRTTAGETATYTWSFPEGNPASSTEHEVTVTYPGTGTYEATLMVSEGNETNSLTRTVAIYLYDDEAKYNTNNNIETFEGATTLDDAGYSYTIFGENNWSLQPYAYNSTNAMGLLNYGEPRDKRSYFYTQKFDLSDIASGSLNFYLAFAGGSTFDGEILYINAYADCLGQRAPLAAFDATALISTSDMSGAFYPTEQQQWKKFEVPLAPFYFTYDDIQFEFIFDNFGANNLFIDDISVGQTTAVETVDLDGSWQVYPNPAGHFVTVTAPEGDFVWACYDLSGKKFIEYNIVHTKSINITSLANGMYFCSLKNRETGDVSGFKKLVVNR